MFICNSRNEIHISKRVGKGGSEHSAQEIISALHCAQEIKIALHGAREISLSHPLVNTVEYPSEKVQKNEIVALKEENTVQKGK